MKRIPFSDLPILVRVTTGLSLMASWVIFEHTVINCCGIANYLPYYRVGSFCVWDLAAILIITSTITFLSMKRKTHAEAPLLLAFAFLFSPPVAHASPTNAEANKKTVAAFYDTAFNRHQPKVAMEKYTGSKYIQHNPFAADGKQPFIDFFLKFQKDHPGAHAEIKRMIAEGNLVTVHVHSRLDANDPGRAVMDIFRLENGKIVEHWDVGQVTPEKSANQNTMF